MGIPANLVFRSFESIISYISIFRIRSNLLDPNLDTGFKNNNECGPILAFLDPAPDPTIFREILSLFFNYKSKIKFLK